MNPQAPTETPLVQGIRVIPTFYKGILYRSRIEARWKIFFDAMGINADYETEEFEFADGERYIPDFYLPRYDWYVEVRPNSQAVKERPKPLRFGSESPLGILILDGHPKFRSYTGYISLWATDGIVDFDSGIEFSLDIHRFAKLSGENKLLADPGYELYAGRGDQYYEYFSPQYVRAVSAALTERFRHQ